MRRGILVVLVLAGCVAAARLPGQTPAAGAGQNQPASAGQTTPPGTGANGSANPFPDDTSTVPLMPSKTTPALLDGSSNGAESGGIPLPDEDLDPARSPDDPTPAAAGSDKQNSSSSMDGLEKLLPPPESDQPEKKKKQAAKEPTHQEVASKDLEVGAYYLQTKNWKAALSRFESAMVLDPENPDVYWGLAEADRHLGDMAGAKANYLKLLDYDPDGPHGKEARKALKDPALAGASQPK